MNFRMKMKKNFIAQVLLLCALLLQFVFLADEAKSEECLSYEPAKVKITGMIVRRAFPGPPEFESIEKGDEPETYWILKLTKPICVKGNPDDELNSETEKDIKNMQLVLDSREYARYRHLVSKKVVAEGELFRRHTGYHYTRVLLSVDSMKPAK